MSTRTKQEAGVTALAATEAGTILGGGGGPPSGWYIDFIGNPVPPIVRPVGPLL